jgi:hypothetical protein
MTCDLRILSWCFLNLHIVKKSKRSFRAINVIPTCVNFHIVDEVLSIEFVSRWMPTSLILSHAALSFWWLMWVLSAMYHFQSSFLDIRSLIKVIQRSKRRSLCSWTVCWMVLMLKDCTISQVCSLNLQFFHCGVKWLFSYQITMVPAAHWLTPTLAFSAQTPTCRVDSWIVLASGTTNCGNHKASHCIWGFGWCSMMEWWISKAWYSKHGSGMLNIFSRMIWCGSRDEEGVSKDLEIVSKVGRLSEYIYGLWAVFWIRRHHLVCDSARNEMTQNHVGALIHRLNA